MKLPKALRKNLIERLAILTIVLYGLVLILMIFPILPFFDFMDQATETFDLKSDDSEIESIELVNWFNELEPGSYLIYGIVDLKEHPNLPQSLSDIAYKEWWSEPFGPHGDCFRIVSLDKTVSFVCQNGYAQYDSTGQQIKIGLNLTAKGKQFKTLWETTKNP